MRPKTDTTDNPLKLPTPESIEFALIKEMLSVQLHSTARKLKRRKANVKQSETTG